MSGIMHIREAPRLSFGILPASEKTRVCSSLPPLSSAFTSSFTEASAKQKKVSENNPRLY